MNKERLLAAFGEIDDKIFGEQWEASPEKAEDNTIEPVFTSVKDKKRRKPLIIAASAVAACGVFAAGLALNNGIDRLPTDTDVRIYDSSTIFPDIEFADDYKTMYNAEDLYQVETIEVDPDIANKYSVLPSLIDGKKVYFITDAYNDDMYSNWGTDPVKTAYIIAYDTETKEEKVIYSCTKQLENSHLELDAKGIYNSYLYFVKTEENKETAVEVCRVNLNDGAFEVIFSARHPLNSRFVLSKGDNCLYFGYSDTSALEDTLNIIYRYDTESGKTEKFMENAYVQAAYKNGLIYRTKDSEFYYHNPADPNSDIALTDNKISVNKNSDADNTDGSIVRMPESYGESFFLYQDIDTGIGGKDIIWDVGVEDENGDRPLFAGKGIVLARNSYGTNNGLVIIQGNPGRDKPLIYDYKNDIFSFVDIDPINYYVFSPLGFNSNESVCVRTYHAENSQYESVTITTVTRKREKGDPYNSSDIFPDMEFAEKYKTMYNAEDLYDVNKMEIDTDIINKYGYPELTVGDRLYFTTMIAPFYHSNQVLHTEPLKTADIILYDNTAKEEKVIYSCGKQRDGNSVDLRLLGIYDNYLYFEQNEYKDPDEYTYSDFSRLNLTNLTSEVIYSSRSSYSVDPVLSKGENCIYFYYEEDNGGDIGVPRIYRYDIGSGKTELFMENVREYWAYKDGIIYRRDGNIYYHTGGKEDTVVCTDNYEYIGAYGGEFFLYQKYLKDTPLSPMSIGIYDKNGERDIITDIPDETYRLCCKQLTESLVAFKIPNGLEEQPLIYDYKNDVFSFIEADKESCAFSLPCFGDNEGVAFIGYDGDIMEGVTGCQTVTVTRKYEPVVTLPENSKTLFPDLEFAEGYKNISNAEDLYRVKRMEIDADIINKYGAFPYLADGDKLYFATRIEPFYYYTQTLHTDPLKTAEIILYDNYTKEEKVIYSHDKQRDNYMLFLDLLGIRGGYLYFYQTESGDGGGYGYTDFCRLNLSDLTSEVIYSSYNGAPHSYPAVSEGDNSLYLWFNEYNGGDFGVPRLYRYDIKSGKTELFMEGVSECYTYLDGIMYKKDGNIYYHSPIVDEDTVLCPDKYRSVKSFGSDSRFYINSSEDNASKIFGIGNRDGERDLITGTSLYLSNAVGGRYGLIGFSHMGKPMIYDYIEDRFVYIDADKDCFAFSPLGFEDSGCAAFFEHSGTEKGYTSCELITVTRSSDNIALTEHEEENLLSGYELYTGGNSGEILNAEDLYHVDKEEIYRHIATVNSLTPFESAGALESIYVNRFYGGGRVYLEGTDFYFTTDKSGKTPDKPDYEKTPAQILLYDTRQSGGITVIAEEMPEEEEWGLMLKIAGIFDGYMYYYKTERPKGYIDEENINSLWRVNLQDGTKEKISDIKYDWYLDLDPAVKAGDYIYFTDYEKANDNSPKIYRFNTKTNKTELFKDNVQSPVICPYKDGIIYYSPESYYTYEENGKAHTLCPSDYTGKIDTFGDNIMYAHRIWEDNEQKTVLGIFDENLAQKELGVFPTGAVKDSQSPTEVYGAGEINENFTAGSSGLAYVSIQFGNNILLYDKDKDCFSQIVLSEGEEVVCCSQTENGLAFITAKSGEGIAGYDYNDYEFVRRITLSR